MKSRRILFLLTSTLLAFSLGSLKSQEQNFFSESDQFFKQYIRNGRVDYSAISKHPAALNALVSRVENFDLSAAPDASARKAFWINAYNILVIKGIVNDYPTKSPMDTGGFFDRKKYNAGGGKLTLNDIENKKIRAVYKDARIHFVLVCAAIGCPSIIPGAYFPETLDKQLQERTEISLNQNLHVRLDKASKKVFVSEIFKWYREDFVTGGSTVIEYINRFREDKIPANFSVDYTPYDWRLNEAKNGSNGAQSNDFSGDLNLQSYTPSTLLAQGEIEVKIFNNLYTQTAFFDDGRNKTDAGGRSSFFTGIGAVLYGINRTVNIGADVYFKSVANEPADSSPFSVLSFSGGENARTTIGSIAPKVKISPFKKLRNLAIQTTVVIPVASDLEGLSNGGPFVDFDDVQWWTQAFFDHSFNRKFLAYFEGGTFVLSLIHI